MKARSSRKVAVEVLAQGLVGRNTVGGAASGQAQAGRHGVGHLHVDAQSRAQAQPVAVVLCAAVGQPGGGACGEIGRARGAAQRRGQEVLGQRVVIARSVGLRAHADVSLDRDAVGPLGGGVGHTPALDAGAGDDFFAHFIANLVAHHLRHVRHPNHGRHGHFWLERLGRRPWRRQRQRQRQRGVGALLGIGQQRVGLVACKRAALHQRLDQRQRGLAQGLERLAFGLRVCAHRRKGQHGACSGSRQQALRSGSGLHRTHPIKRLETSTRNGCGMRGGKGSPAPGKRPSAMRRA